MSEEPIETGTTPEGIADPEPQPGIADPEPEGGTPAPEGVADPAPAAEKAPEAPKPEDWTLDPIEGFNVPEANFKAFVSKAKELGLSKEQTAGMLDWHKSFDSDVHAAVSQQEANTLKAWQAEIQQDQEFGGQNWKATLADSRKALAAFDTDGSLRNLLIQTKAQHNPAVIRAIARIGRAMGEHGFVNSNGQGQGNQIPLEDRLYANMHID